MHINGHCKFGNSINNGLDKIMFNIFALRPHVGKYLRICCIAHAQIYIENAQLIRRHAQTCTNIRKELVDPRKIIREIQSIIISLPFRKSVLFNFSFSGVALFEL